MTQTTEQTTGRKMAEIGDEMDLQMVREHLEQYDEELPMRDRERYILERNEAAEFGFEQPDEWCLEFDQWGHLPGMVCCNDPDNTEAHEAAMEIIDANQKRARAEFLK